MNPSHFHLGFDLAYSASLRPGHWLRTYIYIYTCVLFIYRERDTHLIHIYIYVHKYMYMYIHTFFPRGKDMGLKKTSEFRGGAASDRLGAARAETEAVREVQPAVPRD